MRKSDYAGRAGARRAKRGRAAEPEKRSRRGRAPASDRRGGRGGDRPDDDIGYDEFAAAGSDDPGPLSDDREPDSGGSRRDDSRSGRRSRRATGQVDPLSRFSASALKRVSVLGDRPNQIVYTLAEQSSRKTGTMILAGLLGLCGLALVALLGVLVYQLVAGGGADSDEDAAAPIVKPPPGHSTLRPKLYHSQPENKLFDPIAERPEDAEPMSGSQVFGDVEKLKLGSTELLLSDSKVTDTCTAAVWGDALPQALADAACNSAAQGVYQDAEKEYIAQFTLFDVADSDGAAAVAAKLDPKAEPGFLLPYQDGVTGLHKGYSQATTQVMGHYVAVFWVARSDGKEPKADESLATLNVVTMDAAVSVYEQVHKAEKAKDD